jgi:hypothetical protein
MRIGITAFGFVFIALAAMAQAPPPPMTSAIVDSTVHGPDFDMKCDRCHTPDGWRVLKPEMDFDHGLVGFTLNGKHRDARCTACHQNPVFRKIGVLCADCHKDELHQGGLGFDCARCHTEEGWHQPAAQRLQHQQTRFPLVGRHALVDCDACHQSGRKDEFVGSPVDCWSCHAGDYSETGFPDHQLFGFSSDCEECHQVSHLRWSDVGFQHSGSFPLAGGHGVPDCQVCHTDPGLILQGDDCYGCHMADYDQTSQPPHSANSFPTDCGACHDINSFGPPSYYAHYQSGFQFTGEHASLSCNTCHSDGGYYTLDGRCYSCHASDYEGTSSPNHETVGFPTSCEECHNPAGWDMVKKHSMGRVR